MAGINDCTVSFRKWQKLIAARMPYMVRSRLCFSACNPIPLTLVLALSYNKIVFSSGFLA
jgi:hypothetical protein